MAIAARKDGLEHSPVPGRKIKMRGTQGAGIQAKWKCLPIGLTRCIGSSDGPGRIAPGGTETQTISGGDLRMYVWRLWVKPKPTPPSTHSGCSQEYICRMMH